MQTKLHLYKHTYIDTYLHPHTYRHIKICKHSFFMCAYTLTYIHTYIYVSTHMQHTDIYINMDIYFHVHMHKYVHGNIDTCKHARIYTKRTYNSHTYIYTLKYRNPFTQINTDIHIYSTFNIKIYYIYIL